MYEGAVCATSNTIVVVQITATIRYEMTIDEYYAKGGELYFLLIASKALGIPFWQLALRSAKTGSVILDFVIVSDGKGTLEEQNEQLAQIKAALDKKVKNGELNAYPGALILNYESNILSAGNFCLFFLLI